MHTKYQSIGYTGFNRNSRRGAKAYANVSVQATHFFESTLNTPTNLGLFPRRESCFTRKISVDKACPIDCFSNTFSDFRQLSEEYSEFRDILLLLDKLKTRINSCPFVRWRGICPKYYLDRPDIFIHLSFVCTDPEKFEEAENLIDSILASS